MQLGDVIWLTACFAQILEALNLDYDDRIEVLIGPSEDPLMMQSYNYVTTKEISSSVTSPSRA